MKILYLSDELNAVSGVSKHLYYLIGELQKHSEVEAHMIVPGGDYIKQFRNQVHSLKILSQLSFEKRSAFNFIYSILYIAFYCIKNNIDLINSHTHYCANIVWYASKIAHIKTVQTNNGIIPETGRLNHFKADHIVVVNKNTVRYLVNKGFSEEQISLVYYGIPLPDKMNKNPEELTLVCASRLIPEKGVDIFAKSLMLLKNKLNRPVKIIIAGEGEQESEIRNIISNCGLNVQFPGKVNDLNTLLSTSHIFVFPSWSVSEGFPLSFIEAALNKNLIITTDFVSLKEIYDENDVLIIKEKDETDLAAKIINAVNNFSSYQILTNSSFEKAASAFNLKNNTDKLISLYKEIVHGK